MTAEVIDGRKIARALKAEVALEVDQLNAEGIACGLATVAVGDDFSASAYQRRLEWISNELGVPYRHVSLAATSQPDEVLSAFHVLDTWLDNAGEDRAEFYHRSLITVVGRP